MCEDRGLAESEDGRSDDHLVACLHNLAGTQLSKMNRITARDQHRPGIGDVTSFATDRSDWPTGICRRVQRVTYRKDSSGAWKRTHAEVRRRCEDPD